VHPTGAVFDAEVVVGDPPVALLEGTVMAKPGSYPAIVRLSRGFGLPLARPDVHGLAIRLLDAGGTGWPQDLLLATVRRKRSAGLRFNLANDAGGLRAVGTLNIARKVIYRASQFGREVSRRPPGPDPRARP
jgi:hypothetical protein